MEPNPKVASDMWNSVAEATPASTSALSILAELEPEVLHELVADAVEETRQVLSQHADIFDDTVSAETLLRVVG